MLSSFRLWLVKLFGGQSTSALGSSVGTTIAVETAQHSNTVPYDEQLLERARNQWLVGDWEGLSGISRDSLQHHPDRAKIALLAASGLSQTGQAGQARQFTQLAVAWGCPKRLVSQILISGVHNTIGRASAVAGLGHFEKALALGTPGATTAIMTKVRITQQLKQSQLEDSQNQIEFQVSTHEHKSFKSYPALFEVHAHGASGVPFVLGMNANKPETCKLISNQVEFSISEGSSLYFVSNENGNFSAPSSVSPWPIRSHTFYELSGQFNIKAPHAAQVWVFQYDEKSRIDSKCVNADGQGAFTLRFQTKPKTKSIALGIRVSGLGKILSELNFVSLHEDPNGAVIQTLESRLSRIQEEQNKGIANAVRQIESFARLQQYMGANILMPDMHNWPISPDFGVLLIQLIEDNNYDAIIEFGSGTSTLLMACALYKVAQRCGLPVKPLLSFDHLPLYRDRTHQLLAQANLTDKCTRVELAELVNWHSDEANGYNYYDCAASIRQLHQSLDTPAPKVLVVVDGPPANTCHHARFPALAHVLQAFGQKATYQFIMDDYIRSDEQEIVKMWQTNLQEQDFSATVFDKLEKKACLLTFTHRSLQGSH
jgi:hypothetical protein